MGFRAQVERLALDRKVESSSQYQAGGRGVGTDGGGVLGVGNSDWAGVGGCRGW